MQRPLIGGRLEGCCPSGGESGGIRPCAERDTWPLAAQVSDDLWRSGVRKLRHPRCKKKGRGRASVRQYERQRAQHAAEALRRECAESPTEGAIIRFNPLCGSSAACYLAHGRLSRAERLAQQRPWSARRAGN